jgi:hypothetical protein
VARRQRPENPTAKGALASGRTALASAGLARGGPRRPARRATACAAVFALIGVAAGAVSWGRVEAAEPAVAAEQKIQFDIAPQPLSRVVEAYASATGVEVVYDPPAGSAPQSPGVRGLMTPRAALAQLLVGTGLSAHYLDARNIVLEPIRAAGSAKAAARAADGAPEITLEAMSVQAPTTVAANPGAPLDTRFYASLVGFAVEHSLEADATTAGGDYAGVVQLWIGAHGEVSKVRIARTTGRPRRDAAVLDVLGRMVLDQPPPGLPEPVTVAFTARRGR